MTTTITGVDPGLVHTGVVHLHFGQKLRVEHQVFDGDDPAPAAEYALQKYPRERIFVEAYTDRSQGYGTGGPMRELMAQFKLLLPHAKVLDNMGVKQVVRRPLMELLGCWTFSTVTHHQDLRSAARIAIFGALKDPELNRIIYDYVTKELDR